MTTALHAGLAALWPSVCASLPASWRTAGGSASIASAAQRSPRVWAVHLTDGHRFALKLAAETAPLRGEIATLTWLQEQGCPVPRIVAVDPSAEPAWVALEWAGDESLDHALQMA